MKKIIILLGILLISNQMSLQSALAFDHYLGFNIGRGAYANNLGDMYPDETTAFGVSYSLRILPVLGLSFHLDHFTKAEGSIEIQNDQGHTIGEVSTDLTSYIVSAGPTIYLKFLPFQPIVPHVGAGLSYYSGRQNFSRNGFFQNDADDFSGVGYYGAVGIDLKFLPWIGFIGQGKGHVITLDIDDGTRITEKENRLFVWYVGLYFSL